MLMSLRKHDWANMKKEDRKKYHRTLHKLAYPKNDNAEELTTEQLAARIRGALGG